MPTSHNDAGSFIVALDGRTVAGPVAKRPASQGSIHLEISAVRGDAGQLRSGIGSLSGKLIAAADSDSDEIDDVIARDFGTLP